MNDLKVIENELVPVYVTDSGEKVVYGTELHAVLEVKSRFNDWVKNRLKDCDAAENKDFGTFTKNLVSGGQVKEYIIKLDTAKEMAMLERNAKGKQVRRYFIAIEEKYKENGIPKTIPGQIQLLAQGYVELEQKVNTVEQKVVNLENNMTLDYRQQIELEGEVNKAVMSALGGESQAYKEIGRKVFAECNRDLKHYFKVNARANVPKKRFDEAVMYARSWKPCTNTMILIQNCNAQQTLDI